MEKNKNIVVSILVVIVVLVISEFTAYYIMNSNNKEEVNEEPSSSEQYSTKLIDFKIFVGMPELSNVEDAIIPVGGLDEYETYTYGNYTVRAHAMTGLALVDIKINDSNKKEVFSAVVTSVVYNSYWNNEKNGSFPYNEGYTDEAEVEPRIVDGKLYYVSGNPQYEWECYNDMLLKYIDLKNNNLTPVVVKSFKAGASCYK